MIVKRGENSGKDFDPIPAGVHQAVGIGVIDLGTQESSYQGQPKMAHQCIIVWELPHELIEMDDGTMPRIFSKIYTVSLNEKANLYKDLVSWRGRNFTDEELQGFDLNAILGVNCQLNIIHKKSQDGSKTYTNLGGIMPLPKGMTKCKPAHEFMQFSFAELSEVNGGSIPEHIPGWIQDKIRASVEWADLSTGQAPQEEHTEDNPPPPDEPDCPF